VLTVHFKSTEGLLSGNFHFILFYFLVFFLSFQIDYLHIYVLNIRYCVPCFIWYYFLTFSFIFTPFYSLAAQFNISSFQFCVSFFFLVMVIKVAFLLFPHSFVSSLFCSDVSFICECSLICSYWRGSKYGLKWNSARSKLV
jgi:hypothetical protein